jgi:hypothetical protein
VSSPLHLTKVAVGCETVDVLNDRLLSRATNGETYITTRYRPKQAEQVVGGSLYWIIKHRLVVRQTILGFGEGEKDGKPCCVIRLDERLVAVRVRPKRAHQGWRYLPAGDAPGDLDGGEGDTGQMPPEMLSELAGLGLV